MLFASSLFAQVSEYISSVKTGDAKDGQPFYISVELVQSSNIGEILVVYRPYGQSDFEKIEMDLLGMTATATIPGDDVILPYIEFYILIELADGSFSTHPPGAPDTAPPLQANVVTISPKDEEVIIMSPLPDEPVGQDELFISLSLLKTSDSVDKSKTKIYLNNIDITSSALFADDLILVSGENLPSTVGLGAQNLKIELFDKDGNLYHSVSKGFTVTPGTGSDFYAARFNYTGSVKGESRNERYNDQSTWYNNLRLNFNGDYSDWKFDADVYVTSEEKVYLQPQNRYTAKIRSSWMNLQIGDNYPTFPKLIMNGKRIRGISGAVNLGFFNVQASFGQVRRDVEGNILEYFSRATAPLGSNVIEIDSAKYGQPFARANLGTYNRNLFALRPSFGSGETFQIGFSYLHSGDDYQSIEFGGSPQENAVVGTDLKLNLDNRRIQIRGEAAVSIFNSDISEGELSDAEIDAVFGTDGFFDVSPDDVRSLRDVISPFITVNQYLKPLNPQELSTLASEAELSLNYFNNRLSAKYLYRGNDYKSFGQSFIRTDVAGINLRDRLRLIDNQVFVSLGFESLKDNLQNTKIATTTSQTINTSVSYFPRIDFPNLTIGYTRYQNDNGLSMADTNNVDFIVDDATNRFLTQISYDVMLGVKHNTSLNFSTSSRDDNSINNADNKTTSAALNITSPWNRQLTSYFTFSYFSSEISTIPYDYVMLSLGAKYKMLEDKLTLTGTYSPSFGDFERQAIDLIGSYDVMQNLSLIMQVRFYSISGAGSNSIIGLTTRYNI